MNQSHAPTDTAALIRTIEGAALAAVAADPAKALRLALLASELRAGNGAAA